jgi:CBS domain-containing protein
MIARDVMTRDVVSVTPDTPVRKIASLLVKHGIDAVPVIDSSGAPIGIVSEGDLFPYPTPSQAGYAIRSSEPISTNSTRLLLALSTPLRSLKALPSREEAL